MKNKTVRKFYQYVFDSIEVIIIGLTIFIVVYLFVGQLLEVTGESMYPTFLDKEQILAEKISLQFKPPERGEIVIFKHPEEQNKLLIKRIIGLPGETILVSEGMIYINGIPLDEPYLVDNVITVGNKSIQDGVEYKIPNYTYVLMGDNREKSSDSRVLGAVKEDLIIARAMYVYFPLQNARKIVH